MASAKQLLVVTAAKVLKAREAEIPGTVVLVFQPAEEGGAGGKIMVDEGVMEGVLGIHGVHVWPNLPSGTISTRVGPVSFHSLLRESGRSHSMHAGTSTLCQMLSIVRRAVADKKVSLS